MNLGGTNQVEASRVLQHNNELRVAEILNEVAERRKPHIRRKRRTDLRHSSIPSLIERVGCICVVAAIRSQYNDYFL